ncbi:hypothetical protein pb186bvf_006618 [Paramecium bursaria]
MENINQVLEQAIQALDGLVRQSEADFWTLTKVENRTPEQEIEAGKKIMILQHDKDILESLIQLKQQNPDTEIQFPIIYALEIANNQLLNEYFSKFKIQDNSEQMRYHNITDEQVQGFLVLKFDDMKSSEQWEDESNQQEVFEIAEKDIQDLEDMAEKHDEKLLNFDPPLQTIQLHSDTICCMALNPSNKELLVTASCDDSFKITNLKTQTVVFEKQKFPDSVCLVAFSLDGKNLAVGIINGNIHIFSEQKSLQLEGGSSEPTVLQWHPKGKAILAGFEDSTIWLWNGINGQVAFVFGGHEAQITCGGFSLDGNFIYSGSEDASFRIWRTQTSEQLFKVFGHGFHKEGVHSTGSSEICILNSEKGKAISKSEEFGNIVELCFITTNQKILVAGDQNGGIYVYNWGTMSTQEKLNIAQMSITKIIYDKKFYISTLDGKIISFDHRQMNTLKVLQTQSGIFDMIVDESIIIGCENGSIYIY